MVNSSAVEMCEDGALGTDKPRRRAAREACRRLLSALLTVTMAAQAIPTEALASMMSSASDEQSVTDVPQQSQAAPDADAQSEEQGEANSGQGGAGDADDESAPDTPDDQTAGEADDAEPTSNAPPADQTDDQSQPDANAAEGHDEETANLVVNLSGVSFVVAGETLTESTDNLSVPAK